MQLRNLILRGINPRKIMALLLQSVFAVVDVAAAG